MIVYISMYYKNNANPENHRKKLLVLTLTCVYSTFILKFSESVALVTRLV